MQRHLAITLTAALAIALGGCDMIGEELAERAVEGATGTDVEVDEDGVNVESDEGSFSADEGGFSMDTEDGSFESRGGQVPEDFPGSVPLPDAEVVNGSRLDGEDGIAWMVNFQYDSGQPREVLQAQVEALQKAGFTTDGESNFSMGDDSGGMAGALLEGEEYRVNISVIGEPDDFVLGYQVFEIPPDQQ